MPTKPLPTDRDVLLRMLDELRLFLAGHEALRKALYDWRRGPEDPVYREAFVILERSIERMREGNPPLMAFGRIKAEYPILERMAELRRKVDECMASPGSPLILSSDYLDVFQSPAELRAWLEALPRGSDRLYEMCRPVYELLDSVMQAIEGRGRPGRIDYVAVADSLRQKSFANPAALVMFMADRPVASVEDIAEHVHGNGTASTEAVRKNVSRTRELLIQIEPRLSFHYRRGQVRKRESFD